MKNKQLETTLKKLIQKTEQALEEGSIYSDEYQEVLRSAKKTLPNQKEEELKYPKSEGFHILQQ